ncbi:DUF6346 domain-containing protein [Saccharopolyspora sp. NPDC049426]|uniref:DUF6346 domain-containing protein n=1 Tax=Saccharopolyspora sp. NPDC049426 TaxID=3155652 RepID=UPI0034341438
MAVWRSDELPVRMAKLVGGLVVTACIAMLWPTIIFSFPEKHERPNATALVQSCEDTGPVTRRGFGHNWDCTFQVRDDETGKSWTTTTDMNLFSPEDVGEEKRLTWGYGGSRFSTNTAVRTYTAAEGYSAGFRLVVITLATIAIAPPALWMFAKSLVWGYSQAGQREFWERISGTPAERAEERRRKQQEEARFRERQRAVAAERRAHREARAAGIDAPSPAAVPGANAAVVRYREGWGMVIAGLISSAVGSLFLYIALYPEEAVRSSSSVASVVGWFFAVIIFVPSVLVTVLAVVMTAKPVRVHVDERGIYLPSKGALDLVTWNEVRALHGRMPRPKVKDDPNSKPIPAALLFQPADDGFLAAHPQLVDADNPQVPRLHLPGKSTVNRLTRAIASFRPDLLR